MYSFLAFAFKVYKKCYYYPKSANITQKYQYGYKKTQNFMLISNSLMPAEIPLTKDKAKNHKKNAQKQKYSKFA
jgi:hypothetical protein